MEFTITCPIDGPIEVSLEDIETVVVREAERADITFVCPHCGTQITVTAVVPAFLMAAIEALADESELVDTSDYLVETDAPGLGRLTEFDGDPRVDAYCEYFRRQLSHVDCVEDAIAEIDSSVTSTQ